MGLFQRAVMEVQENKNKMYGIAKGKEEKERYTHINAEFQRIAKRDKKVSFSYQCKEIKENNRTGKTRDLFKKLRDTREHFM